MLSIIIPTLNEERHLPRLLKSIKSQKYTDYEIIVADAGSKDATVTIAKEHGCKVVPGGLLPAGRNRGAEASKGDILLFLDADIVLPDGQFLKKGLTEFNRRKLGCTGFRLVPESERLIDKFAFGVFTTTAITFGRALPHAAAAIMIRKNVHEAIGGFDEEIVFVEDHPYVRNAGKIAKFGFTTKEYVYVSVRRYDKDGRWKTFGKYFLAELYITFLGPIKTDIFKYKFAHYKSEVKSQEGKTQMVNGKKVKLWNKNKTEKMKQQFEKLHIELVEWWDEKKHLKLSPKILASFMHPRKRPQQFNVLRKMKNSKLKRKIVKS